MRRTESWGRLGRPVDGQPRVERFDLHVVDDVVVHGTQLRQHDDDREPSGFVVLSYELAVQLLRETGYQRGGPTP